MRLMNRFSLSAGWVVSIALLIALFSARYHAAADSPAKEKIFLWEVKSPSTILYLLGSMHATKPELYPLHRAIEEAYRNADVLGVEADIADPAAMQGVLPLMIYQPPDTLQKHVTAGTFEKLILWAQATGQNAAGWQVLRPAFLSSFLILDALKKKGYDPGGGIDLYFLRRAKDDGKSIVELESVAMQMKLLGGLSDEEGNDMLLETLKGIKSGTAIRSVDEMAEAWKKGDLAATARLIGEDNKAGTAPQMFKKLFEDRNAAMAEKIDAWMKEEKRFFIVVGAGHLAGRRSIVNLLRAKGFQIRQLP